MIYILEGPDGTGKTTLANTIAETKKTSVLHSYFDKSWDIQKHHHDMLKAALIAARWRPVVLDRWADSEAVYGQVFRGQPGYDVDKYLFLCKPELEGVVWIYCRNDNAVENHLKNKEKRNEMFDDMTQVVELFDNRIASDTERSWITYDFDKVDMHQFVKELPGENYTN